MALMALMAGVDCVVVRNAQLHVLLGCLLNLVVVRRGS
jgi:hypothetical protein